MGEESQADSKVSQLVIFDCDGVLVDSERLENQLLIDMATSCGLAVDVTLAHQEFVGRKLADCIKHMECAARRKLPGTFIADYRKELSVVVARELQPVPGVHAALAKIKLPMCVASNGPRDKVEQALHVTKLRGFFEDRLFSAYDVNAWKPEPDLFLHAAKIMGAPPQLCTVIEDSHLGVQAAMAAGMRVIAYAPNGSSMAGVPTIERMDQLPEILTGTLLL